MGGEYGIHHRPLADVLRLTMGQSPPGDTCNRVGAGVPLLNGPTEFGTRSPTPAQWTVAPTRMSRSGEVLFCVRGSTTGRMNVADREYCIGRGVASIGGSTASDNRFAFHALAFVLPTLLSLTSGSVFPNLSKDDLGSVLIPWPPAFDRQAIAEVLGVLDDKIESNRRRAEVAKELASVILEDSLSQTSRPLRLDDLAQFHNRRRVPLSARERSEMLGSVPYYGATGVFGYVDRALFDDVLVLVGEDGSVVNDDGTPVVQYVWGPSWVNNHAHVVTGAGISTDLLYLALRRVDVRPQITGAVQPKLNMGNLKSVQLQVPDDPDLQRVEAEIAPLLSIVRNATDESATLTELRDALLPELLSGRLRVPVAEELVESAT